MNLIKWIKKVWGHDVSPEYFGKENEELNKSALKTKYGQVKPRYVKKPKTSVINNKPIIDSLLFSDNDEINKNNL